jgi:hypothetical protein
MCVFVRTRCELLCASQRGTSIQLTSPQHTATSAPRQTRSLALQRLYRSVRGHLLSLHALEVLDVAEILVAEGTSVKRRVRQPAGRKEAKRKGGGRDVAMAGIVLPTKISTTGLKVEASSRHPIFERRSRKLEDDIGRHEYVISDN